MANNKLITTPYKQIVFHNNSIKFARTNRGLDAAQKPRSATYFKRVCRAWHKTREVKVLLPGNRRAEG
jgi:hypothetical protein